MPAMRPAGTHEDRARAREAIAVTHSHGEALRESLRNYRERFLATCESLAVERRILREDIAHWDNESA